MSSTWNEVAQSSLNDDNDNFNFDSFSFDFGGCTRAKKVQVLTDAINHYMSKVYSGTFDCSKAERVASLALSAQLELADLLSDADCRAKTAKYEVELIESEVASKYREESTAKLTEIALKQMVVKASAVSDVKKRMFEYEKQSKKWNYIFGILKEAHIFFRNLDKS